MSQVFSFISLVPPLPLIPASWIQSCNCVMKSMGNWACLQRISVANFLLACKMRCVYSRNGIDIWYVTNTQNLPVVINFESGSYIRTAVIFKDIKPMFYYDRESSHLHLNCSLCFSRMVCTSHRLFSTLGVWIKVLKIRIARKGNGGKRTNNHVLLLCVPSWVHIWNSVGQVICLNPGSFCVGDPCFN